MNQCYSQLTTLRQIERMWISKSRVLFCCCCHNIVSIRVDREKESRCRRFVSVVVDIVTPSQYCHQHRLLCVVAFLFLYFIVHIILFLTLDRFAVLHIRTHDFNVWVFLFIIFCLFVCFFVRSHVRCCLGFCSSSNDKNSCDCKIFRNKKHKKDRSSTAEKSIGKRQPGVKYKKQNRKKHNT